MGFSRESLLQGRVSPLSVFASENVEVSSFVKQVSMASEYVPVNYEHILCSGWLLRLCSQSQSLIRQYAAFAVCGDILFYNAAQELDRAEPTEVGEIHNGRMTRA